MSWQDELQQLDSALASGQISADEYRTRRDRVIAQASGQSSPEPPAPQPAADPTHVFRAVQPQDQADRTQIVSGQQQVGDRTQVVPNRQDADSTQIVSGPPKPAHPHFPPPQPPPPWETAHPQQTNMSPPPWANEDLPPEFGQQSWPRQGPEVFEEKSSGNTGKVIGIIVAVVLVLGLAGGAVWFFALKDKGGNQADTQTSEQTQQPTTSKKPPPPDIPKGPFIDIPGEKVLNRTVPMQQALTEKRPTEREAQLLQSVGVAEIGALVTDDDGLRRGIWSFKVGEGGDPQAVLTAMDQFYKAANYELVSEENGVLVRKLAAASPDKPTVYRAHYVTEDGFMVRVEVYGLDSANVESTFTDLLADETDKFAPVGP
jgi:hypothetical protein